MPISCDSRQLEIDKFKEGPNGETLVAVESIGSGNILEGITWDNVAATYPSTTREVFTYSFEGDQVAVITVDYTNASKDFITNVARS